MSLVGRLGGMFDSNEGELRKIPIPLHYLYVFLAGALIGMFSITGMAGSYGRMLLKVARFNQLRSEKEALSKRYNKLEQVAQEKELQAASLSSLADEVSTLYGLKAEPFLGSPERLRTEHFSSLCMPAVFVHGTTDGFASIAELESARTLIPARTALIAIDLFWRHDLYAGLLIGLLPPVLVSAVLINEVDLSLGY